MNGQLWFESSTTTAVKKTSMRHDKLAFSGTRCESQAFVFGRTLHLLADKVGLPSVRKLKRQNNETASTHTEYALAEPSKQNLLTGFRRSLQLGYASQ